MKSYKRHIWILIWDDALLKDLAHAALHKEELVFKKHRKHLAKSDAWLIS